MKELLKLRSWFQRYEVTNNVLSGLFFCTSDNCEIKHFHKILKKLNNINWGKILDIASTTAFFRSALPLSLSCWCFEKSRCFSR